MADTKENAQRAFNHFYENNPHKYGETVERLKKDRDELTAFYRLLTAHWKHIPSTNVIENVSAIERLRTYKTKGLRTHPATSAMKFRLLQERPSNWQWIVKWQQLELVQVGRDFKDGVLVEESAG